MHFSTVNGKSKGKLSFMENIFLTFLHYFSSTYVVHAVPRDKYDKLSFLKKFQFFF